MARARPQGRPGRSRGGRYGRASRLELLIRDIHDVFAASDHLDKVASATLIDRLVAIDGHPWAEYGRGAKPITQNKLARLPKPLKIAPEQIRFTADDSRKGGKAIGSITSKRLSNATCRSNRNSETNAMKRALLSIFNPKQPKTMFRIENAGSPITTGKVSVIRMERGKPARRRCNGAKAELDDLVLVRDSALDAGRSAIARMQQLPSNVDSRFRERIVG